MKLIRLEFEGIGSFADPMTIDFEALGAAGLFLVEGPTGSGKSTILDAIVFALYGSTAGSNSDLGRMDSHVRQRSRAPFVQLTFEVGGGRYQIRRAPRHQRDKRRGEGTTDDNGSVSLVQLAPQICDLSHKAREVGDWVLEHIGLTKTQFAATIVLAQGEFASFLDANTEARAQILEKVFGTEFYKEVEDQLAAMRRLAIARRQRTDEAVQETLHRCLGALGLQPGDDELPRIDGELDALRADLAQAQRRSDAADRDVAEAEESLRAAETLAAAQERKRTLLGRKAALSQRQPQVDAGRQAVAQHERAVPVTPAKTAWQQATQKADEVQRRLSRARQRMTPLQVTSACPALVEETTQLIGTLQAALRAEDELGALRRAANTARSAVEGARNRVAELEKACAALNQQLTDARTAMALTAEPAEELSALQLEQEQVRAGLETWQALDAAEVELRAARAQQLSAREAHDQALALLTAAEQHRDQDLAAGLAAMLRDGAPCMVCGSVDHPAPARTPASPEAADLADRQRAADTARGHLHDRDADVARREGVVEALLENSPQDRDTLRLRAEELACQIAALRQAQADFAASRDAIEVLRDQLEATSEELAQARVAAESARGDAERATSALEVALHLVEQGRGDHECVADRIEALQAQVEAMNDLLACASAHEQSREELRNAEKVLAQTLNSLGFDDVGAASAALLPQDQLQQFRDEIENYDREQAELATGLAEVGEIDLDVEFDLPALREVVSTARVLRSEAHEAKGSIEYRLGEATPLRRQLEDRINELDEVRRTTEAVIRMADLATANRGEVLHRVKLSSFVLMRRFQSVVDAANDRLDAISEGRYQLVVETRGLDNRGLAGLDLLVADQRTEHTRSTKSLSGGERFYVALALALGLADVVRSESGGVELGTLFIDEGFGSLDADTLEEVLDMLDQVRAGEDRVIGLVSHVDLLKHRIDARISVRRDPQRSAVSTLEVRV